MTLRPVSLVILLAFFVSHSSERALGQGATLIVPHASWNCGMPDGIPST